ncbi:MAG: hypothetical protein IMZ66_11250 [Planctomycetes bacterium]|nr:hypothetical protein [Planctomycetota bacterium]
MTDAEALAAPPGPPGIVCPECGCADLRSEDGRPWEISKTERMFGFIRRRRICRHCGTVVHTRETVEPRKQNGRVISNIEH